MRRMKFYKQGPDGKVLTVAVRAASAWTPGARGAYERHIEDKMFRAGYTRKKPRGRAS